MLGLRLRFQSIASQLRVLDFSAPDLNSEPIKVRTFPNTSALIQLTIAHSPLPTPLTIA